jgi:NADH-ubiquinone oxidoreductase chain 6
MTFLIKEIYTNGYLVMMLNVISLASIFCGISVIVANNPIVSVLFLIGLFFSISCYLFMIGLGFLGLAYLLVYVGAVSILFLFILMLINVRTSELLSNNSNSLPLAVIFIAIPFIVIINYIVLPYSLLTNNNESLFAWIKNNMLNDVTLSKSELMNHDLFFSSDQMWEGNLIDINHISGIGNIMYTNYSIWLIIASIILLLAMVGAIVITIKQKD